MLVLSRKNRESVVVGRSHGVERLLKITVLEIHDGTVSLGFEAGDDFPVQDDSNGQRKPERRSYYEAVANAPQGAEKVLFFGSGAGASGAMEELLAQLNRHHGDLAKRVVGSIVLDETHLTENQLLARARDFYANVASSGTTHLPERRQ
jgi:hypothetical protein